MDLVKNINDGIRKIIAGQDKKKIIENSIIVIIVGIILLVAGSSILKNRENAFSKSNSPESSDNLLRTNIEKEEETILTSKQVAVNSLQKEMEEILSQIGGVGKVNVMITFESGYEIVPAYDKRGNQNDTKEEDSNGGKRVVISSEIDEKVAYEEEQGGIKKPIILKELEPKVKGVVVVADGAGQAVIKENLVKAVQALVDIAPHKIQVFGRDVKDSIDN